MVVASADIGIMKVGEEIESQEGETDALGIEMKREGRLMRLPATSRGKEGELLPQVLLLLHIPQGLLSGLQPLATVQPSLLLRWVV